jgi:hypothetical protein
LRAALSLYLLVINTSFFCQSVQSLDNINPRSAKSAGQANYTKEDFSGDSAAYVLRKPSDSLLNELRKDKELNYAETEGPTNLFEFISIWINEQFQKIFRSSGFRIFEEYLSYFIAAAALIIVIIILYKNKLSGIIYGVKESSFHNIRERHEDINKIDFDALISSALTEKEYRVAARYHYLKSLKLLSEKKLINWQINKTNTQYLKEISDPQLQSSFMELTLIFEWFWYGNYPLEEPVYFRAQDTFNKFNRRLAAEG